MNDMPLLAINLLPTRKKENLEKLVRFIFFKEIFVSQKQLIEVVYSELFDEMLKLRVLTREKPTQDKDTVIIRGQLGV